MNADIINIRPLETIEYYDGPLLFLGEDEQQQKYVCSYQKENTYLCSLFSKSIYARFFDSIIDLRTAILDSSTLNWIGETNGELTFKAIRLRRFGDIILPREGYYI